MKSRKRIISAMLAAGIVISLAGCAENEQYSPESSVTSTESTVSATSTTRSESKPSNSTTQSTVSSSESKPTESTTDDTSTTPTTSSIESKPEQNSSSTAESKPEPTESKPAASSSSKTASKPAQSSSKPTQSTSASSSSSKPTQSTPESTPAPSSNIPESKPKPSAPLIGTYDNLPIKPADPNTPVTTSNTINRYNTPGHIDTPADNATRRYVILNGSSEYWVDDNGVYYDSYAFPHPPGSIGKTLAEIDKAIQEAREHIANGGKTGDNTDPSIAFKPRR